MIDMIDMIDGIYPSKHISWQQKTNYRSCKSCLIHRFVMVPYFGQIILKNTGIYDKLKIYG